MLKFQNELAAVRKCMIDMAELTLSMVERSVAAMMDKDLEAAERIAEDFIRVDIFDRKIEAAAIRILTLYHPMASDMRAVATYLKSISYLERIAKYCKNIAVATKYLYEMPQYDVIKPLKEMGHTAAQMVGIVVNGLKNATLENFDKISEMDDMLDKCLREDMDEVIAFISECPESAPVCTFYISVMKYLERIGDHSCKVAEKVTFMVTGFHAVYE